MYIISSVERPLCAKSGRSETLIPQRPILAICYIKGRYFNKMVSSPMATTK
jgi:hypothetical protein